MGFPTKAAEREYNAAYYVRNSTAIKAQVKSWYKRNPDKVRFYQLKCKYGITKDQFFFLFESQGRRCAICRRTPEEVGVRYLDVDHCHVTGRIRGLLCNRCNLMLANAVDSEDLLKRGSQYLTDRKTEGAET